MILGPRIAFFNRDQLEMLKAKVFELLAHRGVKMDHPEVLKILDKAGATVDFDGKIVRFTRRFLEKQISKAPKNVTLVGRNGKNKLEIPTMTAHSTREQTPVLNPG